MAIHYIQSASFVFTITRYQQPLVILLLPRLIIRGELANSCPVTRYDS